MRQDGTHYTIYALKIDESEGRVELTDEFRSCMAKNTHDVKVVRGKLCMFGPVYLDPKYIAG